MNEQAAPELDALQTEINALANEVKESAPLETEAKTEVVAEPTEIQATATETQAETTSEYVETDNDKVQKRMNKMHFDKMEETRRADALQAQLSEMQAEQAQTIAPIDTDEPNFASFKEEDYNYDDSARQAAYGAALTKYQINKQFNERETLLSEQQANHDSQQRQQKIADNYFDDMSKYSTDNPTYLEDIKVMPEMSQDKFDLMRSQGAKMVHYLSKNPEQLSTFIANDFGSAAVQLGALGNQFNTKQTQPQISNAPAPTETISGTGGAATKDLSEMSMGELMGVNTG